MKLLLCEDEEALGYATKSILEANNYKVDLAINGEIGYELISQKNYDLIILDIMMPKKDGITLLKEIRNENIDTKVIILSAKSEVQDTINGLDSGADDYIAKPYNYEELLARVRNLTKKNIHNNTIYKDITINKNTLEVSTNKGCLCLSNKEYSLLEYLIISKNKIITSEQIIERLWKEESNVDTSVVQVYISYLKKKLKLLSSIILIKGKAKTGYYLDTI